jgi:hypothetical protein
MTSRRRPANAAISSSLTALGLRACRHGDDGDFTVHKSGSGAWAVVVNDRAVQTVVDNRSMITDACRSQGTSVTVRVRNKRTAEGVFRRAYVST